MTSYYKQIHAQKYIHTQTHTRTRGRTHTQIHIQVEKLRITFQNMKWYTKPQNISVKQFLMTYATLQCPPVFIYATGFNLKVRVNSRTAFLSFQLVLRNNYNLNPFNISSFIKHKIGMCVFCELWTQFFSLFLWSVSLATGTQLTGK